MTTVDWIALAVIAHRRARRAPARAVGGALSLAGIAVGAYIGAKLAPHLLPGGASSPYTPLAALGGAAVGACSCSRASRSMAGECDPRRACSCCRRCGCSTRSAASCSAPSRARRSSGSSARSRSTVPGQTRAARGGRSARAILGELNARVPPRALARRARARRPVPRDPRARGAVAAARSGAARRARRCATRAAARRPRPRHAPAASASQGRGWVAAPNLVVTAAHVVAGMKDTRVDLRDGDSHDADVVAFDVHDDIAVLRVAGLGAAAARDCRPRSKASPSRSSATPRTDRFTATPGRIGETGVVLTRGRATGAAPSRARSRRCAGGSGTATPAGRRSTAAAACETTIFAARVGVDDRATACRRDIVQRDPRPRRATRPRVDRRLRRLALRGRRGRPERPPERRDDVDAGRLLARLLDQLARERACRPRAASGPAARRRSCTAPARRSPAPRCGSRTSELQARHRPDADEQRDRRAAAESREERVEVARGRTGSASSRTARRPRACAGSARPRDRGRRRSG